MMANFDKINLRRNSRKYNRTESNVQMNQPMEEDIFEPNQQFVKNSSTPYNHSESKVISKSTNL